jgi:hypothetical protein
MVYPSNSSLSCTCTLPRQACCMYNFRHFCTIWYVPREKERRILKSSSRSLCDVNKVADLHKVYIVNDINDSFAKLICRQTTMIIIMKKVVKTMTTMITIMVMKGDNDD